MNKFTNNSRFFTRLMFVLTMVLALAGSFSAQVKLRDALDFDGDDKADYVIHRSNDNTFYVNKSGGGATFQQYGIAHYDTPVPGDYDGDGKADFAVWRYTDRVWYVLNSSTGTVSFTQFGLIGDEPIARDYDGDGKTDIAVIRRAIGGNMTWYVQGSTSGFFASQFGLSTDTAVPGDYDGDGKFDLAVYRQGSATGDQAYYYIRRTSDSTVQIFPWGLYGDTVVPGDYDGDGKTDAAVMRRGSPNEIWYVFQSSDGGFKIINFGLTETDFPTQNDYDGDGKTDFAVWRETDGTFYVFNSLTNSSTAVSWGFISDFPIAAYDAH